MSCYPHTTAVCWPIFAIPKFMDAFLLSSSTIKVGVTSFAEIPETHILPIPAILGFISHTGGFVKRSETQIDNILLQEVSWKNISTLHLSP